MKILKTYLTVRLVRFNGVHQVRGSLKKAYTVSHTFDIFPGTQRKGLSCATVEKPSTKKYSVTKAYRLSGVREMANKQVDDFKALKGSASTRFALSGVSQPAATPWQRLHGGHRDPGRGPGFLRHRQGFIC